MSDRAVLLNGDCLEVLKELPDNSVDSLVTDPPAGISFMGKEWDEDKGGRKQWVAWMTEVMKECLRVLKPGAHGLVWAIPRTSHWTATALEDAGFEVRDVVTHIFGSGFPKSQNISIAIDKQSGAMGHRGKAFVTAGAGERKDIQDTSGWEKDEGHKGITPEAKQWQGWGTALKPASEHWILVRKPIAEKTVAANVLTHGTGGINIDESRISTNGKVVWKMPDRPQADSLMIYKDKSGEGSDSMFKNKGGFEGTSLGRFPANLVLSHNDDCEEICTDLCAVAALDEHSGILKNGGQNKTSVKGMFLGEGGSSGSSNFAGDSGGASRFFYCAKASKKDKGEGNIHPTVKSSSLMSYLIKLITPPNGIVLDPFTGSGSTGVSAIREGFSFIGIEKEEEYFNIAEKRINSVA